MIAAENASWRQFMERVNAPESYEQRLMREAREARFKQLDEARERLRARGIDPDSL
ncbi:MAG: hypothetical protein KGL35_08325 [Bradyrhizobium sp.]|nr:hypothetical protein [Bradyrhizobium sp.]